jgi:hypothetical protein
MLDLVGDTAYELRTRFLEPACGDGNFLEEILLRKLSTIYGVAKTKRDFEFLVLLALTSIYGVDISRENVLEARRRLRRFVMSHYSIRRNTWRRPTQGFCRAVDYILSTNVLVGDFLDGGGELEFIEYSTPEPLKFAQAVYRLDQLRRRPDGDVCREPEPVRIVGPKHYLGLGGRAIADETGKPSADESQMALGILHPAQL